jgi:hypothetical protein
LRALAGHCPTASCEPAPPGAAEGERSPGIVPGIFPFPGVPPVTPATITADGRTLAVERVTDAYVIVSEHHHLAVGAGALTVLELDTLRAQFLQLREQVPRGGEGGEEAAARVSRRFDGIDRQLGQATAARSEEQVREMPQWSQLDEGFDALESLLRAEEIDREEVREKHVEVQQMLRNARYRVDPAAFGLRAAVSERRDRDGLLFSDELDPVAARAVRPRPADWRHVSARQRGSGR